MDTKQPEALRIAEWLEGIRGNTWPSYIPQDAAAELRRQHAETVSLTTCLRKANAEFEHFEREWYLRGDEIEALQAQMEAVGAGGVGKLAVAHPTQDRAVERDELLQAAINFIQTLTGMTPPPIEVAPPEVFAPFRAFVEKIQEITDRRCAASVEPLRKRPVFGLPGTRDVDVAAAQKAWDAAQAQPAQAGEREAFEAWVAASGRAHMLKRDDRNDWYADLTVTAWWTAWQASAARGAAQAAPDFQSWVHMAYRSPEATRFTIHNMEVAYKAGRDSASAQAAPVDAAKDLHDEIMRLAPTDADIIALADETRTGEPGRDGYILPISFARAVLAKWGAPAPAASEAQPVAADDVIFLSGKAAGRQEVKDEQQSPDFWTWIRQAYREPESTKFTIYNMEVAYQAGRETAAPSGPAREPLADEQIEAMAKPFVRSLGGDHWYSGEDGIPDRGQIEEFARAIEAEVRKQDESLIRQMLEALECNGEPDGPGHRCSHCDDYVDRNSVLRYAARKRLESKP